MKYNLLVFCFFTSALFAQNKSKSITEYYDNFWKSTNQANHSYYVVKTAINGEFSFDKKTNKNIGHPSEWLEEAFLKNGSKITSGAYFKGYYNGVWYKYYPNGILKDLSEYKFGEKLNTTTYHPSSNIKFETKIFDNKTKVNLYYYPDGIVQSKNYYKDNINIADTSYYSSGKIEDYYLYKNGEKSEKYSFNLDGSISKSSKYSNDTTYTSNYNSLGEVSKKIIYFKNDKISEEHLDQDLNENKDYANGREDIFSVVETMPRFFDPSCEKLENKDEIESCSNNLLMKYLSRVEYPFYAINNDIMAKEFIRFIIDEEGNTINVECARCSNSLLSEAAIRHIEAMPKWEPGFQRGKKVKVKYVVPINFKLG